MVTLQAISGAGYPGVSALDIIDNVVPFVSGEEPKLEAEPLKILGSLSPSLTSFVPSPMRLSAQCNRVATIDGHLECVSVRLKREATVEEVIEALESYTSEAQTLKLPSAPPKVPPRPRSLLGAPFLSSHPPPPSARADLLCCAARGGPPGRRPTSAEVGPRPGTGPPTFPPTAPHATSPVPISADSALRRAVVCRAWW